MPSQSATLAPTAVIDPTDVPRVAVRELATALKALVRDPLALAGGAVPAEIDLRRAEHIFWQRCPRDRQRKVAALVRLRCLVVACRSRRLSRLVATHGNQAIICLVEAAAELRLNSGLGFSEARLVWATLARLNGRAGRPAKAA